ncbi:hypothetical protein SDC9_94835 [bioreactor metagenome]|uniref:Uncharacterized protein n=1 Tax=bioreactor metagenome TaxID=1076179 RepID=A0A645ABA4_9ZZZZ
MKSPAQPRLCTRPNGDTDRDCGHKVWLNTQRPPRLAHGLFPGTSGGRIRTHVRDVGSCVPRVSLRSLGRYPVHLIRE